ncbi:MAG TPA: ABC transporter ATP-binding protein [Bryobacterales bacterium]|nr:ABC transporter ATP-binding protein [Bryobacterales bacterium]
MPAPAIETESLTKHFQRFWSGRMVRAVDGISLEVPPGVAFGLLGPNGSGKTTFVKLLLTAVVPTAGRARLFGRDCRQTEARLPVGYLPENHRFPTYNTGLQMLDFYAALSGMGGVDRKRRARELLDLVGLADWGGVRIGKYSKGMLQRLGLAQALMHRPSLLILDEPTDGVDPVGRRQIRDILSELRRQGTTIFLNSHLLAEAELFCDRAAIISRGKVALAGSLAELTAGSGYRLTAAAVPEAARVSLQQTAVRIAANNGEVDFQFADRETANRAIDLLREAGSEIESVTHARSTLEEVFVRTVQEQKEAQKEAS